MDSVGILTLAHSHPRFARQARWLARSIRRCSGDVPIAVATHFDRPQFEDVFDIVVPWRFDSRLGVATKLELFDISPFTTTLFIDSDCLCIRPIEPVFDCFDGQEFAVYGSNSPELAWGDGSGRYRAFVDARSYPSFNGGLYYFRKSALAERVFRQAQSLLHHYDELGLRRPHGRMNDEPLISLAMAAHGLTATATNDMVVMVAPEPPRYDLDLDLLRGRCSLVRRGRLVEPGIVHFAGPRSRLAAYRREGLVLDLIVSRGWPRAIRPLLGAYASFDSVARRAVRKLRRLFGW